MVPNLGAQRLKRPLENARGLRERSTQLQAQSKYLRKLVEEQHYETLLLIDRPASKQTELSRSATPRIVAAIAISPNPRPVKNMRETSTREGKFLVSMGAGTEFLRAELLSGMTRASIAQNTSDEIKKRRNRRESRKAYDAILRFLPQAFLSQEEKEEIDSKVADLKFVLRSLGEEI